ncbi:hypothetical protein [Geobacter metallireducens]|uniref:hypothetical protein n=1 Tax=Geobacter metallireducens TaxID=28232 RepID=UPI0021C7294E|nr:hypothetical protein [Geobacter metallireducens]
MNDQIDFHIPERHEFCSGYEIYNQRERRGPIWFDALEVINKNWGNASEMERGVSRIIRGWNRFYARYDKNAVIASIDRNIDSLSNLRDRGIETLTTLDSELLTTLFNDFLSSLKRLNDNRKSPVSVAKTLSLFAPAFLPIWDSNIAWKYNCFYIDGDSHIKYLKFCEKIKYSRKEFENLFRTATIVHFSRESTNTTIQSTQSTGFKGATGKKKRDRLLFEERIAEGMKACGKTSPSPIFFVDSGCK